MSLHCILKQDIAMVLTHAFVPYCTTRLRVLRAFTPYVPYSRTLSMCLFHAPFSRALPSLYVCLNNFLGQICSPAETFHFPRTNCNVFICIKKIVLQPFKQGNF